MSNYNEDISDKEAKTPTFSAFGFHDDLRYDPIVRWVNLEQAQKTVDRVLLGPAAKIMQVIYERVIITDGGDSIVFEWKRGQGVTWPTREQRDEAAKGESATTKMLKYGDSWRAT